MTQEPLYSFNPAEPDTWEALARYLVGESPEEEAEAVRGWLAEDPSRLDLLTALDRSLAGLGEPGPDVDVEAALQKVKARMEDSDFRSIGKHRARRERRRAPWRMTGFRVAASAVLLLGVALVWRAVSDRQAVPRTFATAVGQADSVRLPDGSFVLLGPDSRLTLAGDYGDRARELELDGEAFFNVVHDVDRPFTVTAGDASILDLGTTFTVRTDQGEAVHVVVTAGSVLLNDASAPADEGVVLNAGDRGLLGPDGQAVALPATATDDDLAWTRGRLVFDNASLARVAADLRRWYGIEMSLTDPDMAARRLTAVFEGESIDQVLDVIGLTLGVDVERVGNAVRLQQRSDSARR